MYYDLFSTRFYRINNLFPKNTLLELLNKIKEETKNLAELQSEGKGGSDYLTNFQFRELHSNYFTVFLEELNGYLKQNFNISFEIIPNDIWYQEYGENSFIEPHTHLQNKNSFNMGNRYSYSGIVNISDIGETAFINPNISSFGEKELKIESNMGEVILFPSNLYHYSMPHRIKDRKRAVFSFNGFIQI